MFVGVFWIVFGDEDDVCVEIVFFVGDFFIDCVGDDVGNMVVVFWLCEILLFDYLLVGKYILEVEFGVKVVIGFFDDLVCYQCLCVDCVLVLELWGGIWIGDFFDESFVVDWGEEVGVFQVGGDYVGNLFVDVVFCQKVGDCDWQGCYIVFVDVEFDDGVGGIGCKCKQCFYYEQCLDYYVFYCVFCF